MQTGTEKVEFGERNAVIVAHPDDESMWFGGLIAANRDKDIEVVCCTVPRLDPERAILFFDACRVLGARPKLIPFQESGPGDLLEHLDLVRLDYDVIVTHGHEGDYGHLHHQQVYHYVMSNAHCPVWTTCGTKAALSAGQTETKREAIQCYDHVTQHGGVKWQELLRRYGDDVLYAEGFRRDR